MRCNLRQINFCAAVSCALKNLEAKTTGSVNEVKKYYLHTQLDHAKKLILFLKIMRIDNQYSNVWNIIVSYDQFGDDRNNR